MDTWTLLIGGVIGLFLAVFGVRMLVTGRAPAATARSFRTVHDAALYHLLFGAGLLLLVAGTRLPGERTSTVTAVLAVLLAAVAVFRYRPRGTKKASETEARGTKSASDTEASGTKNASETEVGER